MEVEGLFRIPGSQVQIEEFKEAFDSGQDVDLSKCKDPNTIAGLLKLFLREQPGISLLILVNINSFYNRTFIYI